MAAFLCGISGAKALELERAQAGDGDKAYLGHKNIQHTVRYTELSPTRFKKSRAQTTGSVEPHPQTATVHLHVQRRFYCGRQ